MEGDSGRTRRAIGKRRPVIEMVVPSVVERIGRIRKEDRTKTCRRDVDLNAASVAAGIEEEVLAAHQQCVAAVEDRGTVAVKVPDDPMLVVRAGRAIVPLGRAT